MKQTTYSKTFTLILCCLFSFYTQAQTEDPRYVPGQVLVKLKANRTVTQKNDLKNQMKASLRRSKPNSRIEVWDIDQSQNPTDIRQVIAQYRNHPDIEYIEPNYYYYLTMEDCVEEASAVQNSTPFTPASGGHVSLWKQGFETVKEFFKNNLPRWRGPGGGLLESCEKLSENAGLKPYASANKTSASQKRCPNAYQKTHNFPTWEGLPSGPRRAMASLTTSPNDALYSQQWPLHNTGQADPLLGTTGTPDADIDAPEAWDIATGSPSIVVGLIDSGVDWRHPDLVNNIWQNLGEDADGDGRVIEWNGNTWIFDPDDIDTVDSDSNGYVNDFIGWDFINNDNNPFDSPGSNVSGHGTHVAGTIGAEGNNGIGVAGVTWDVQIAALRVFAQQNTTQDVIAEALDYAVMMNMPISNNSYGRGTYSDCMIDALTNAEANGHLFVGAADNFNNDNDDNPNYPSSYPFDNIISVAATNRNDLRWTQSANRGSNYGETRVDLAAPGRRIISTYPGNGYRYNTGTSMATPHVTGACALLWEQHPDKTYTEIKEAVMNTVDSLPDLEGKCVSEGRLNLYGALTYFEEDTTLTSNCTATDYIALRALYLSTGGDNWTDNTGWPDAAFFNTNPSLPAGMDMTNWYGISLDENGCIVQINMRIAAFVGNNLTGNIPVEINNLNNLTSLDLSDNQITGNIPPEIGNLINLTYLNLGNNQFIGNIPSEIGNLVNLTHLYLYDNQLIGNIPSEIGNLINLTNLSLSDNELSGSIPPEIGNLNKLIRLFLSGTQLSGNIPPEIGNLSSLESFYSTNNQFSGCIPSEIGNLSNLFNLHLSNNQLSGSIPPEIGTLSNLGSIRLNGNQFSGSIPSEIGNLNLVGLWLNDNQFSGCYSENLTSLCSKLPAYNNTNSYISDGNNFNTSWEDFCNTGAGTCSPCRQSDSLALVALYNSTNGAGWTNTWNLNQSIDTWSGVTLDEFACVIQLYLAVNNLSGSIPPEIGNLSNLTSLQLQGNNLSGGIPPQIGNLSKLTSLSLFFNQLSGNIPPEIGNLSKLTYLHLKGNQLSGSIPPEIGNLSNLTRLYLRVNNLSGSIPPELGNLNELIYLYLDGNQLNGSIPAEIGNLSNLTYLDLFSNQLSGCYNENLTGLCNQLSSTSNNNSWISDANNFDAPWEDFCNTGTGTCTAPVWPGDYNYDGTANETDALYWGLAFNNTGLPRPDATTAWQGQQAPDWLAETQGINGKHQDGNGDGVVDGADLQVLDDNFGSIHAYTEVVYTASSMVYELVEAGPDAGYPSYDLYVRGADGDTISAHGLAGVIDFGDWNIDDVTVEVDNSSLEPSDTLKAFDPVENRFHFALTRTDDSNRVCIGPVAHFIIVTQNIPTGDSLKMDIENGTTMQANGDMANIAGTTFYAHDPGGIANNNLVVGASVLHEQCTMPGSISLNVEGGNAPYSYVWNIGTTSSTLNNLTPGIYEVTVTDLGGQTETLSVEVQGQYISMPDASGNFPDCINAPCPTLIAPNGNVPAGTYKAATAVNSTGSINGDVDFKAGEMIILRPGFEVPLGIDFSGEIEACDGN